MNDTTPDLTAKVRRARSVAKAQGKIPEAVVSDVISGTDERYTPGTRRAAGTKRGERQLKLWNDRVRGLPNAMARSALFSVSNKPRKTFKEIAVVSSSDFDMYYTGEEMRQADEDCFLQVIHLARFRPLGEFVDVSGYQLLKALGWSFDARSYKRLRESIERLKTGSIKIHFKNKDKRGYFGSMIRKVEWAGEAEGTTKWRIYLEPEIINLFDSDGYSLILWEQRLQLRNLAKWLLSFYYTHSVPLPYKVETIYGFCGSGTKTLAHFRAELKISLEDLKRVDFLEHWEIEPGSDLVKVVRKEQPKQVVMK